MKSKPKVSVIVTHHLNINDPYLKACLLGLKASHGVPFEVVLMSDSEIKPDIKGYLKPGQSSYYWDKDLDTATKKISVAVEHFISKESTHLMILSDDVIVSQHCIASLYESFQGRHMIMNPMSNSDLGSRYETVIEIDDYPPHSRGQVKLKPDMMLEDLTQGHVRNIIRFKKLHPLLIRTDWVSFYATMVTKQIWDMLQGYDKHLEFRHNDQDFCMRASKLGVPSVINLGAFAFHFGSRTMKYVSDVDKNKCTSHFLTKWNMQ